MSVTRASKIKIWSVLYDYKKMVGRGFFTRSSRKEFIKKIEKVNAEGNNCSELLKEFSRQIRPSKTCPDDTVTTPATSDTGFLGQSRLYGLFADQGIYSKCQGFHHREPVEKSLQNKNEQKTTRIEDIQLLRDFTIQLKANTSFWYGGFLTSFFRSQRKEMAFDTIISTLEKHLEAAKYFEVSADSAEILRCVLRNALVNRGSGNHTSSGLKAMELLKDAKFSGLIKHQPNKLLNYDQLKEFVSQNNKKQVKPIDNPYRAIHFHP